MPFIALYTLFVLLFSETTSIYVAILYYQFWQTPWELGSMLNRAELVAKHWVLLPLCWPKSPPFGGGGGKGTHSGEMTAPANPASGGWHLRGRHIAALELTSTPSHFKTCSLTSSSQVFYCFSNFEYEIIAKPIAENQPGYIFCKNISL